MNFIISSSSMLHHLQAVSRVISSKNTLPILDNFLFQLKDNELIVTASDLETTLVTRIPLESSNETGEVAIDAKRITTILKEFPEQPLTFNIDKDTLTVDIISENGKFSIMGQNSADFPQLPEIKKNVHSVSLTAEVLLQGVSKTLFAASDDELRPVMTGINIELSTDHLTFVASDAHKLVRYRRTDVKASEEASFILPQKPAGLLKNILPKDNSAVNLQFDAKNALVEFNGYKLICRLVEGNYPNYEAVIPKENPNKLTIDRLDFYNSLRRVSVFSNQASNLIKLSLTANQLTVSAQDIDFSISAHERVKCQFEGDDMEIGFKSLFLIEILANLASTDVVMNMSDPTRAGVLEPLETESEHEDVLMLLMPMMING
ncbi:MAG TPA: DNA polymerase III subunit beta [Marinilabiliales bacterium]|nr:MAG: DNA polymerase III subunit beta [Bacteroidetes bacterium GWA2_40_14]OFX61331.1 MAG: DNA polymerase III subunit beta [Bacteroidetes bacterium GWC2_40_13]OFX75908.1 MAG: DNA polymerase III subunit beta [Bacteroidetes bacterium GWD2_40_43]OFX90611.1 MAG: DNA polymerase III subunit beta [Bacteroidetes bacterium GWE2_40_63]OFY20911.1 MAG: DNA polymerase III subunit beta [Bacteroidetes bacterium GWF2_40_13]OFZ23669.1 MAG: DNA polymerase III subunit beta [Bacteroidetes bacterium RIFOXYC2_FULL